MQVVIDIPKAMYDEIKSGKDGYSNYVHNSIRKGIPLSKGHGKLKDTDKIVTEIDSAYPNLDRQDIKQWVFNADTIIEADKESEE